MPGSPSESKARVRTRTGCLQCRKRRKKCDEHRPTCHRCTDNGATCTWPSKSNQPIDGRRREARLWKSQPSAAVDENHGLYAHFATAVMPRLVRPNCPSEYIDHSYILHLAHGFPPLMAVMVAIAAADLGRGELAMDRYLCSLRSLQDRLADAPDAGNEDGLLATTISLCLFENLRSDGPPSIGLHAKAAGVILSRRQLGQAADVVFERTCAESFLYHSTLMMLLDPSLDMVVDYIPHCLTKELATTMGDEQVLPHYVLEESYQFFIMIAEVTRLARLSRPLFSVERQTWTRLQVDLLQYKRTGTMDDLMKSLYVYTAQILLLKADYVRTVIQRTIEMRALCQEGMSTLKNVDVQRYLLGYSLWPVAVLGATAVGEDEQRLIDNIIDPWVRSGRGQAVRLRGRLRTIWATPESHQDTFLLERLHLLMEMA